MLTIITLTLVAILGGVLAREKIVPKATRRLLHKYIYFFAAPIAIIYALGKHDYDGTSKYVLFLGVNGATYLILLFVTYFFLKHKKKPFKDGGVILFSSNKPNTIYLGFPLVFTIFGPEAFIYAALIGSLLDALLDSVRIFTLQNYKMHWLGRKAHRRRTVRTVLKTLLMNPFLLALCIGAALSISSTPVPEALRWIGLSASYVALFALGLAVGHLRITKSGFKKVVFPTAMKLFIHPLVVFFPAYFLLDTTARNASVFIAALPSAVLSLIVADNMNLDKDLAARIILTTTLLSSVTLTFWYVLLKLILV